MYSLSGNSGGARSSLRSDDTCIGPSFLHFRYELASGLEIGEMLFRVYEDYRISKVQANPRTETNHPIVPERRDKPMPNLCDVGNHKAERGFNLTNPGLEIWYRCTGARNKTVGLDLWRWW